MRTNVIKQDGLLTPSSNWAIIINKKYFYKWGWLLGCSLLNWNKNLISSALKDCNDIYAPLLSKLKVLLNTYHGIHWTNGQYHALLGNWLIRYLHVTYSHWLSVSDSENVIKKNATCSKRPPKDFAEFQNWAVYDSNYHLTRLLWL